MSELSPDEPSIATAGAARTAELARGDTDPIGRNLTDEDARQISENVTGFFAILAEWSRAETPASANDAGKFVASDKKEVCDGR